MRSGSKILAGGVAASLVFMSMGGAHAAPSDDSEALGQVISTDLVTLDLLEAAISDAGFPTPGNAGPNVEPLNLALLGSLGLDLGSLQLPLLNNGTNGGLLDLGDVGVLNSYAAAPSEVKAIAGAGAVDANGAIDLDGSGADFRDTANINLTDLLDQLGVAGLTNAVVDEVGLEVGAFGSSAIMDVGGVRPDYVVADAKINLSSPLLGGVGASLGTTVTSVGGTLEGLLASDGGLGTLLNAIPAVDLNLGPVARVNVGPVTAGISDLDATLLAIKTKLIDTPLTDTNGVVTANFMDGTLEIDLAQAVNVVNKSNTGLNGLPANSDVIDSDTLDLITAGIAEVVGSLTTQVNTAVLDAVNSAKISVTASLGVSALIGLIDASNGTITIEGTVADFLGTSGKQPTTKTDLRLTLFGIPLLNAGGLLNVVTAGVLTPVLQAVGQVLTPVLTGLSGTLTSVTSPVLQTLTPVIDGVLGEIVQITINDQPTVANPAALMNRAVPARDGLLGEGSFSVSALTLTLLPTARAAKVSLATSSVRALVASIAVNPESVVAGGETEVTGTGWVAGESVSVQLENDTGTRIGAPVTTTASDDGTFVVDLPVAKDTSPAATYKVVAANVTGQTAETNLAVTAPVATLTAFPNRVVAGSVTEISGQNFPGSATVNVQLVDKTGAPIGAPVTVTTDAEGQFTTSLTVPVDAPVDNNYKVIGSVLDGVSAETPLAVVADNGAENTTDNTGANTADNGAENTTDNGAVNTAVNAAENTGVNTAVNAAENTGVNTAVNAAENTTDNGAVNTGVNTADNGAVNTADNGAVNTADNTAVNSAVNTSVNTAVNAAENTTDNGAVNTAVNAAENTTDNGAVNTADNDAENTGVNTADNGAVNTADNTAVNSAVNTSVNTADNDAENSGVNSADNGAVNTADNTAVNSAVNTSENTAVNTDVNTADNGAENAGVNSADNGAVNTADNTAVNSAVNNSENTAVNAAENTTDNGAVNTADNTAVNSAVNTSENTGVNTDVNTADNGAENSGVNSADNGAVNTADNTAVNSAVNTSVNTAVNTTDNGAVNTADNDAVNAGVNSADNGAVNTADNTAVNSAVNTSVNTAVNAAENTTDNGAVNTADNDAENTGVNTADNGAVNTADNTAVNSAVNTSENTAVNTDVNTADNGAENAGVNSADNGAVNTADNTAVNSAVNNSENTAVNAAENTTDNGAVNTADNTAVNSAVNTSENTGVNTDVNTADNGAENSDVNTADNGAENSGVNTADNGAENSGVNTADNGAENSGVNTADNGAENSGVNTADNGAENSGVNTADNGAENTGVNTAVNTADNPGDNTSSPTFELVPGTVTAGEDSQVSGEHYTSNGTVTVKIKDGKSGVETELTNELIVGEKGGIDYVIDTQDLAPGIHKVTVVDNATGKSTSKYLVVNAPAIPQVNVDVSPKSVVQGVSTLLTGEKFSANETATVEIAPIGGDAALVVPLALAGPTVLKTDQAIATEGTFALRVDSADLAVGDYQLLVTDNKTGAADTVTFTVTLADGNAADNSAANTAADAGVNTADNTADNATASTSGGDNLANTGAQSLGLLIGAGSLLLLGAGTMLLVRKRKSA